MEENKLDKQDVEEVSGGYIDSREVPTRYCPKCTNLDEVVFKLKELKKVEMQCVDSYSINHGADEGYVYRCPECGYEYYELKKK